MIDVHILTLPSDRQDWFEICIASLKEQPITLHVLSGTKGNIGKGRYQGFSLGQHPYVSFVDPDDLVTRNGFKDCLGLLNKQPMLDGVYTAEDQCYKDNKGVWRVKKAKPEHGSPVHHLLVLKRGLVEQYASDLLFEAQYPETRMLQHMKSDGVNLGYTQSVGYVWRRYRKEFPWQR